MQAQVKKQADQIEQAHLLVESLVELAISQEWTTSEELAAVIEAIEAEWEDKKCREEEKSARPGKNKGNRYRR